MSVSPQKLKKKRTKPSKSRPVATSSISLPVVEDALESNPIPIAFTKDTNGGAIVNKRYAESSRVAVASGAEIPHDPVLDGEIEGEIEGGLDADLAELSLGERLAARTDAIGRDGAPLEQRQSGSDAEGTRTSGLPKRELNQLKRGSVPAHSLTRTLIQALHSGDTSLLEACLTHSDETLVRNTVARLPSQLAVPLLNACVERLGRGPRGTHVKGRGGGASAQRGMALMKWVRAVLIIHGGHLMTMPDLVARLSHLHSTLTTRLTLQERLLPLSGRLDLVLAQVELRSSTAPAPLGISKQKSKKRRTAKREPLKYIEGESTDEEEEDEGVEIEEDDESSVEDVELGGESEEVSDEENDHDSDEVEDSDEGNLVNGFIDDEAEENLDEDESEDESE